LRSVSGSRVRFFAVEMEQVEYIGHEPLGPAAVA
jgi:hypothetical protein